ncbi:thiol-activated cytolysin family protein [bacterium]|nr:thiol-activated cytolysin family protein [bacterium]
MKSSHQLPIAVRCIAAVLAAMLIVVSCSEDESPTGPAPIMTDISSYLNSLPAWDVFCPPVTNCDSAVGPTEENLDLGQGTLCRTTPCSITSTPEEVVTYGTFSNILWLGGLIQGDSYAGGVGSMEELPIRQRAPLRVGVNFLSGDSISMTVNNPDAASVQQAIGTLISNAVDSGYHGGSSIYFTQKEMFSLDQGVLSLGLSARYMGTSVRNKLDISATQAKHTVTAYFKQFMFETFIVLPQTPADFFTSEFTDAKLQEQVNAGSIGPTNLPVFVSRVQWGRIMLLTMSSDSSIVDIRNALKATHGSFGVTMTAKYQHILSTSEIEVVTFGGDDADALALIQSGDISSYFNNTADLQTAFPIGYALCNLTDNSLAKVGETTQYDVVECSQVTTQVYHDWTQWRDAFAAIEDSSDNKFFATSVANVNMADENWGWTLGSNTHLATRTLTFQPENTGYDFMFYLRTLQEGCAYPLTYNDDEFGSGTAFLSIGDVDNCQYDAFEIVTGDFRNDSYVFAIGVYIGYNVGANDEKLEVFHGSSKIAEWPNTYIPTGVDPVFLGIVSTIPITKYVFTEGYDSDDIYIKDFCFGVAYR